jgi:hypothetical protein
MLMMQPFPKSAADKAHDVLRTESQTLKTFFAPKTVAAIGATDRIGGTGRTLLWKRDGQLASNCTHRRNGQVGEWNHRNRCLTLTALDPLRSPLHSRQNCLPPCNLGSKDY